MPIFGRHYQRGTNIPTEVVVGYNYSPEPSQAMVSMDLETDFDIDTVTGSNHVDLVAGTQVEWNTLKNQFEEVGISPTRRRYFQFIDISDEVIVDDLGEDTFYTSGTGEDGQPSTLRLHFNLSFVGNNISNAVKIRMRKARAVYSNMSRKNNLSILWQDIFADPGIAGKRNDGYGYQYVLLPSKGKNWFPEYLFWRPNSSPITGIPIYPYNAVPSDIPGNTMVFVRSLWTWGDNEYYYIRQLGFGGVSTPTHLQNLMLLVSANDDGKPIDRKPPSDTPVESTYS
jgi:hypothetical protein